MKFTTVSCPLCSSTKYSVVYKSIEAPEDRKIKIDIVRCSECGLVYQNPRPDLKRFVHDKTENIERTGCASRPVHQARLKEIEKHVNKGAILDVGCGYGEFLFNAKSRGWDAYGVEPSKERTDYAKKHGLKVKKGFLKDAKFPAEKFSTVTMLDVLEHLPDPRAVLKECRRIMKKDGVLVLRTPLVDSVYAKVRGKNWYYGLEHLAYYSLRTLRSIVEAEGFRIERIYYGDEAPASGLPGVLRKIHLGHVHLASATVYSRKI